MNAIVKKIKQLPVMSETEALMTAVERMARDPAVDPMKVQAFIEMRSQLLKDAARTAYARAFVDLQNKLPTLPAKGIIPVKGARKGPGGKYAATDIRSRYVRWEDAIEELRPILHDHGFSLSHRINTIPPAMQVAADGMTAIPVPGSGGIEVTTVLQHAEGHSESTSFVLPIDVNEYRNKVQDFASTVSYGKRYTAFALLGIIGRDEVDTDGATPKDPITDLQHNELLELCSQAGDIGGAKLVNYLNKQKGINAPNLAGIPAEYYDFCEAAVTQLLKSKGVA